MQSGALTAAGQSALCKFNYQKPRSVKQVHKNTYCNRNTCIAETREARAGGEVHKMSGMEGGRELE